MVAKLSYAEIRRAIEAATRRAYERLRKEHPDEHFYVFGLCSDELGQYVMAIANTTEERSAFVHNFVQQDIVPTDVAIC